MFKYCHSFNYHLLFNGFKKLKLALFAHCKRITDIAVFINICTVYYLELFYKNLCLKCLAKKPRQIPITFINQIKFTFIISIFILLSRRKATEALIHSASSYPSLLLEMSLYCCPLLILSAFNITVI